MMKGDQNLVVYNLAGEVTTEVSVPWAKDAEGKDVETWFTTDGQSLTQHVKHDVEGIVYPVTADPWWKNVVNFIGGCIGWHEISRNGWNWIITKGGRRFVTRRVFSRFIPYVGWVACGVGGFAAI